MSDLTSHKSNDERHTVAAADAQRREVAYLVLPNAADPFLLARVRWPDVYQAISPVRPYWQDDPGLFDLPHSPSSTALTYVQAEQLAAEWGATLPTEDENQVSGPSLIRRMPSDWSGLSTAERRAWSIEPGTQTKTRRWPRRRPAVIDLTDATLAARGRGERP